MTEEELRAIEYRASEVYDHMETTENWLASEVFEGDIPALIAEVRRLQEELRSRDDALDQGNEGYASLEMHLRNLVALIMRDGGHSQDGKTVSEIAEMAEGQVVALLASAPS